MFFWLLACRGSITKVTPINRQLLGREYHHHHYLNTSVINTCPKRSPKLSISILLAASATLPRCITNTSRVAYTTGQLILSSITCIWHVDKTLGNTKFHTPSLVSCLRYTMKGQVEYCHNSQGSFTSMLFAMSSPWDPFFLAAFTNSLKNRILSSDGGYLTPV